ncbi:MAG: phosphoglycerate kinase [Verrucomicrobiales bacterium]
MNKLHVRDINPAGKRVLVRVDFNVPMKGSDDARTITDDTRIRESLPTIQWLIEQKAKVILMAHLGRPKGEPVAKYSLKPVVARLHELLNVPVYFAEDCVGKPARDAAAALPDGEVLLLENLRFHAEEEKNDEEFANQLASIADVYVNDAFGAAHRAHASTAGIADHVSQAAMGLLMERELKYLVGEIESPQRPFLVILGGAKVSDKIGVISALLDKADVVLIGGAMAYTFALAQGRTVGNSLCEKDKVELAKDLLAQAEAKGVRFLLPSDNLVTDKLDFEKLTIANAKVVTAAEGIPDGWEGVDIGPETAKLFSEEASKAKTIFWNGPMGIFEIPESSKGTFAVAEAVANADATSIIGGGDSVTAINKAGMSDRVSFISTGGGASLELLEGKALPGITALHSA